MKITIDTAHDSKSDIEKAIEFLKGLISGNFSRGNDDYTPNESAGSAFGSMFGDPGEESGSGNSDDEDKSRQGPEDNDESDRPAKIELY